MKRKMTRTELRRERYKYMINTILNRCEKNNWKRIGLSTSNLKYRHVDEIACSLNEQAAERKLEIKTEELKPINYSSEAVEQARLCDIIVLIEKYGDSYYHEVQNCIDLAGREGIKIAGVVAYR